MKKTLILALVFVLFTSAFPQIDPALEKEIDSLFVEWNSPNHPGGAVGIVSNGTLVYSKAYGLASLEYLVPNTAATRFNIASVSKQFTAMGIIKLSLQGKLDIDDDIRQHLSELPDFGQKVTIRHMLHHTSGLRSLHSMLSLAGWRGDDARTNEDLWRFMLNQRDLNFTPGDEYMYCNTGYILMALLIERKSGEKFSAWMKKEIFEPLGLYDTYVEDLYNRVVPNNATSYAGSRERGFVREVEFWGYTGSGNVHSTTRDLLKWYRNYHEPQADWEEAFALMLMVDELNSGQPNDYAFGVRIDSYKGEKRISHSGSIGGFRAYACTYPERNMEIVVLTNFSSSSAGGKANAVTDILLDKPEEESVRFEMKAVKIDPSVFDSYTGTYTVNEDSDRLIDVIREKDAFFLQFTGQGRVRLSPASQTVFFENRQQIKIEFNTSGRNSYSMIQRGREYSGSKTTKYVPTEEDLAAISGEYWSPELLTMYAFLIKDGSIIGYHNRHGEFKLTNLRKDEYLCGTSVVQKITFERDSAGRVSGLFMTNSRVRNLWFEKKN